MTDLVAVAPRFIELAHGIVYCSVATVDPAGRPRARVMHPIWEWDGTRLTGWLATTPSPKLRHLAQAPYTACAYYDGWAVAAVAECRAEVVTDDATRARLWRMCLDAGPPLGYDPGAIGVPRGTTRRRRVSSRWRCTRGGCAPRATRRRECPRCCPGGTRPGWRSRSKGCPQESRRSSLSLVDVLERAAELEALSAAVAEAGRGRGRVVLVAGEAGIGKTTLVRAFLAAVSGQVRPLVGGCDDLIAPRTFGALRDAARAARGPLAAALAAGLDRDGVFGALLDELAGGARPAVLVVEDVHWADDATLDLVRLLGRRIDALPAVLVLTYRPDQPADGPSLPRLLGAFTGPHVRRLTPAPLTPAAVGQLAARVGADPAAVLAATAGNPFFVTEVLGRPHQPRFRRRWPTRCSRGWRRSTRSPVEPIERLAVIPAPATRRLVEILPDGLLGLAPAERLGLVEIRADTGWCSGTSSPARAIEASLPEPAASRCTGSCSPTCSASPTRTLLGCCTTRSRRATRRWSCGTGRTRRGRRPSPAPTGRHW